MKPLSRNSITRPTNYDPEHATNSPTTYLSMYLLMSEKDWLSVWGGGKLCSPLLVKLEQAFSNLLYITSSQCRILLYSSSNVCIFGSVKNATFARNFSFQKCILRGEILIGFPWDDIQKQLYVYLRTEYFLSVGRVIFSP